MRVIANQLVIGKFMEYLIAPRFTESRDRWEIVKDEHKTRWQLCKKSAFMSMQLIHNINNIIVRRRELRSLTAFREESYI